MNWNLLILPLSLEQCCKALWVQNPTKFSASRKCRLLMLVSPGFSTLLSLSSLRDRLWASGWSHQQAATWTNLTPVLARPFRSPNPLWLLPVPSTDGSHTTEVSVRASSSCDGEEGRRKRAEKEGKRDAPLAVCSPKPYQVFMERGQMALFSLTAISSCHCSHQFQCFPELLWKSSSCVRMGSSHLPNWLRLA